jgi:DUF438 domain-containing protein
MKPETLKFQTGSLTKGDLELLMDTMPVDITLLDKDDKVAYFNKLDTRIFKRSPSVIGKDVRNCHPKKSIGKVQEILDDFRAKKRDFAEFWIDLDGVLVYIRYFPLYKDDKYAGCLEVSMDITRIKKIKGEKRLL